MVGAGTLFIRIATWNANTNLIGFIVLKASVYSSGYWSTTTRQVGATLPGVQHGEFYIVWLVAFVVFGIGTLGISMISLRKVRLAQHTVCGLLDWRLTVNCDCQTHLYPCILVTDSPTLLVPPYTSD